MLEELSEEYLSGDQPIINSRNGDQDVDADDDDDSTITLNWDIQESDTPRKEEEQEAKATNVEENEDVAEAVCDAVLAFQRVVEVLAPSRGGQFTVYCLPPFLF